MVLPPKSKLLLTVMSPRLSMSSCTTRKSAKLWQWSPRYWSRRCRNLKVKTVKVPVLTRIGRPERVHILLPRPEKGRVNDKNHSFRYPATAGSAVSRHQFPAKIQRRKTSRRLPNQKPEVLLLSATGERYRRRPYVSTSHGDILRTEQSAGRHRQITIQIHGGSRRPFATGTIEGNIIERVAPSSRRRESRRANRDESNGARVGGKSRCLSNPAEMG